MIPDKEAALVILHYLLQIEPYEPAPVDGGSSESRPRPEGKPLPPELENKLRQSLERKNSAARGR
jgi:hypothetical protein